MQDHGRCRSCTHPSIYFFHGADSEDHGRLPDELISKHSLLTVLTRKITVGCPWRTYPSIHAKTCADSHVCGRLPSSTYPSIRLLLALTLQIAVVCPSCTYPSTHKNLHTCWTPWSARGKRWRELKTSRVATEQSVMHGAEITLCQHLLRRSQIIKRTVLSLSGNLGRTLKTTDT